MLAANRVPFGPWHLGLLGFVQLISPNPTMKYKLTSTFVKTLILERPLIPAVYAVAVAVSLKAGNTGRIGLGSCPFFLLQVADLYSRIAVVVVLSNAAFIAV